MTILPQTGAVSHAQATHAQATHAQTTGAHTDAHGAQTGGQDALTLSPFYHSAVSAVTCPEQATWCSNYFIERWMPILGNEGTRIVLALRRRGYNNRRTGVKREQITLDRATLAALVGCSEDTITRELGDCRRTGAPRNPWLRLFVRRFQHKRQDPHTGRIRQEVNGYWVAMDDPVHPDDWPLVADYVREQQGLGQNPASPGQGAAGPGQGPAGRASDGPRHPASDGPRRPETHSASSAPGAPSRTGDSPETHNAFPVRPTRTPETQCASGRTQNASGEPQCASGEPQCASGEPQCASGEPQCASDETQNASRNKVCIDSYRLKKTLKTPAAPGGSLALFPEGPDPEPDRPPRPQFPPSAAADPADPAADPGADLDGHPAADLDGHPAADPDPAWRRAYCALPEPKRRAWTARASAEAPGRGLRPSNIPAVVRLARELFRRDFEAQAAARPGKDDPGGHDPGKDGPGGHDPGGDDPARVRRLARVSLGLDPPGA